MTKENALKGWAAAGKAAKDLAGQDRAVREQADQQREYTNPGWAPLADIRERPHGDTRQVAPFHVLELAESIAALGLLEPLVIDRKSHLLAGAHRWAAAKLLAIPDPEERAAQWAALAAITWPCLQPTTEQKDAFDRIRVLPPSSLPSQVPVRFVDLDAETEGDRALAIEVAENEKRRDYTKGEVEALADRLSKAGYRISRGKPKAGERALGPALAVIIGKSERQVRRILGGEDIRTDVLISSNAVPAALGRIKSGLKALREVAIGPHKRRLAKVLEAAEQLQTAISAIDESA